MVAGHIIMLEPTGVGASLAAGEILFSLSQHKQATGRGKVFMGRVGYAIPRLPSGRESFSPNTSYYDGPRPDNKWDFLPGPPTLAVEVRDEFAPLSDSDRAAKRADYFAAGTLVVWDVDPDTETVHVYRPEAPEQPTHVSAGGDRRRRAGGAGLADGGGRRFRRVTDGVGQACWWSAMRMPKATASRLVATRRASASVRVPCRWRSRMCLSKVCIPFWPVAM